MPPVNRINKNVVNTRYHYNDVLDLFPIRPAIFINSPALYKTNKQCYKAGVNSWPKAEQFILSRLEYINDVSFYVRAGPTYLYKKTWRIDGFLQNNGRVRDSIQLNWDITVIMIISCATFLPLRWYIGIKYFPWREYCLVSLVASYVLIASNHT